MKKEESQSKNYQKQTKRLNRKRPKGSPHPMQKSNGDSLMNSNNDNLATYYKPTKPHAHDMFDSNETFTEASFKFGFELSSPPIQRVKISFQPIYSNANELNSKFDSDDNFNKATEKLHSMRENYLLYHSFLDEKKRLILLDWIMQVTSEMGFKRCTYHSAVVLIDLFLSKTKSISLNDLQLLGVSCLVIAAKNEEIIIPCIRNFAFATADAYTKDQIISYETKILLEMNWKIQFPNLITWSDFFTSKWDSFVSHIEYNLPLFRSKTQGEDYLLKNFYLLIDVISLDYYHMFINEKLIACSVVFLLIGLSIKCLSLEDVLSSFTKDMHSENFYHYNEIFNAFCENEVGIHQEELSQTIKYVCQFFNLQFEYSGPIVKGITFEENNQMQTRNQHNIESMRKIWKLRTEVE